MRLSRASPLHSLHYQPGERERAREKEEEEEREGGREEERERENEREDVSLSSVECAGTLPGCGL